MIPCKTVPFDVLENEYVTEDMLSDFIKDADYIVSVTTNMLRWDDVVSIGSDGKGAYLVIKDIDSTSIIVYGYNIISKLISRE
jgi:hypothetical protein